MEHQGERRLSVVIPAFNEAQRIPQSLDQIIAYLSGQGHTFEIVLVDDGSVDGTIEVVREVVGTRTDLVVLKNERNRGKGFSVKRGMLEARGQYVLFTDADLSTPIEELQHFWPALNAGVEVVIGSRKMEGARISVHQPLVRESMGKVFTWLTNTLVTRDITDVTCGFKCFTQEAARAVFSRQMLYDWSFDAEILFLTRQLGLNLVEVPVRWHDTRGTKVHLLKDAARSLAGLARIRWNHLSGGYHLSVPVATPWADYAGHE